MVRIAIIDYGIGNLRSIKRSLEEAGSKVIITRKKEEIVETDMSPTAESASLIESPIGQTEDTDPMSGSVYASVTSQRS